MEVQLAFYWLLREYMGPSLPFGLDDIVEADQSSLRCGWLEQSNLVHYFQIR